MKAIGILFFGLVALSSAGYVRNRLALKTTAAPAVEEKYAEEKLQPIPVVQKVEDVPAESSYSRSSPVRSGFPDDQELEYEHLDHEETDEEAAAREAEDERLIHEQAKSAKYSFASAVDDGIMDHSHVRQETRDGLKVTGSYSYSDGFYRRTVNYEADENGYRVVSEESEPIGAGPNVDLVHGKADVHTHVDGVDTQYSVKADEILITEPTPIDHHEEAVEPEQEVKEEPKPAVRAGIVRNRLSPH